MSGIEDCEEDVEYLLFCSVMNALIMVLIELVERFDVGNANDESPIVAKTPRARHPPEFLGIISVNHLTRIRDRFTNKLCEFAELDRVMITVNALIFNLIF